MGKNSECPQEHQWLQSSCYHKTVHCLLTINFHPPHKEYTGKKIKELHELVYWQKISHPLVYVLSRRSLAAGRSACMRCTTRVQQDLCFPKLSYLLHVDWQSSHLTEGVLDITLSFLKDTLRKINSFTPKSKMLNRGFLFSVRSWSNNVVSHLASCGTNL